MKKYLIGAGAAAALLAGSVAIAAWSPIGLAGAQDTSTTETPSTEAPTTESTEAPTTETTQAPTTDSTEAPAADEPAPTDEDPGHKGHGKVTQWLDDLVADGIITQEQADAIRSRFDESRKEWESDHPRISNAFKELRDSAQAIADTLGLPVEDVVTSLGGGSSLNDLAAQQGVDPAAISQILLDSSNARIDEAVADGKLTQEQADEAKAKIAENIGQVMDGSVKGLGGFGHGGGHGLFGDDAPPDSGGD